MCSELLLLHRPFMNTFSPIYLVCGFWHRRTTYGRMHHWRTVCGRWWWWWRLWLVAMQLFEQTIIKINYRPSSICQKKRDGRTRPVHLADIMRFHSSIFTRMIAAFFSKSHTERLSHISRYCTGLGFCWRNSLRLIVSSSRSPSAKYRWFCQKNVPPIRSRCGALANCWQNLCRTTSVTSCAIRPS